LQPFRTGAHIGIGQEGSSGVGWSHINFPHGYLGHPSFFFSLFIVLLQPFRTGAHIGIGHFLHSTFPHGYLGHPSFFFSLFIVLLQPFRTGAHFGIGHTFAQNLGLQMVFLPKRRQQRGLGLLHLLMPHLTLHPFLIIGLTNLQFLPALQFNGLHF
jgi:hypothetical protein